MDKLEREIQATSRAVFDHMKGAHSSVFDKNWWSGKILESCMKDDDFKVQMFRFVDVFPVLRDHHEVARHVHEYFSGRRFGFVGAGLGLASTALGTRVGSMLIERNVLAMAKRFIAGADAAQALPRLEELRTQGLAFTIDLLGEATVSEVEADAYAHRYLELLSALAERAAHWAPDDRIDRDAYGSIPRVNVSIKLSSLSSQIEPADPAGSAETIKDRLRAILASAREKGVFVNVDMERYETKGLFLRVFQELLDEKAFADWADVGIAMQAYLRETEADLRALVKWLKKRKTPITVRLVKGAYWDYETVLAHQKGWPIPVFENKYESDLSFEACTAILLDHHRHVRLACASHNVRSISHAVVYARKIGLPDGAFEVQTLYGMAESIKHALCEMGLRVRDYVPVGELIPGMAYFVRRLLENTSNESFLRLRFAEGASQDELVRSPAETARLRGDRALPAQGERSTGFANEPQADYSQAAAREKMHRALWTIRGSFGTHYPLFVGGHAQQTDEVSFSIDPAHPSDTVGVVAQASVRHAEEAIRVAREAFPSWRDTPAEVRAALLRRAAKHLRQHREELSALEVFEAGKTWREADADVTEAIDFLEYYAPEAVRLSARRAMGRAPGESNTYFYEPRGVGVVIAPWNFPLAILCGMTSGALAAGNCVIMKPASQTPVIAAHLMQAFWAAQIPTGVVQLLPGRGAVVGEHLAAHRDVDFIAFTGSREVGLHLVEVAARTQPGQRNVKRVIAEMGGKNAIIVDSDADLDEAVQGIVHSAFGYQGQKCSACSRVIVLADAYDALMPRLIEATRSLKIGSPDDPATRVGPVIDAGARGKILDYIERGKQEGRLALQRRAPNEGYYVGPTIFTDVAPDAVIAQEEIFGPVLAVIRVASFEEALEVANGTAYALTGGLYSRSPARIARATEEFRVGNLYVNRGITGALVERQPFGGSRMSGVGSKAGGPDYLLQFLEPRVVTENTMRRGFAPEGGGNKH